MLIHRFRHPVRFLINCTISSSAFADDMYNYYVNHATTKRLFSQSNPNSFFFSMVDGEPGERGERVPHCSLFFHGLLAGSQGYIHQTPSAPIVSLHLRSSDDLHEPFRPFMHMFKYRQSRKFIACLHATVVCLSRNKFR